MKNSSHQKTNRPGEAQPFVPLHEQIETRAYEIWIASGGGHGRDLEHWHQAETEILKGRKPPMPTAGSGVEGR